MRHTQALIVVTLLGAVLACGGSDAGSDGSAQATIEAAVARISATIEPGDRTARIPTTGGAGPSTPDFSPAQGGDPTSPQASGDRVRDFSVLDNAAYLEQVEPQSAEAIRNLPWIADSVSDHEVEPAEHLTQLAAFYQALFWKLIDYPWIQDGLTEPESSVLLSVLIIAQYDVETAEKVAEKRWLSDDVTAAEGSVVEDLALISQSDVESTLRLATMPFLATVDAPDVAAMQSLQQLAFFDAGTFQRVMAHPTVSVGISDDWAMVVATLGGVGRTNPALIGTLLDPDQVSVETRTVDLPLSGEVVLAIIRTQPGAPRSMDLLGTAVLNAEDTMGAPLPVGYVGVLFELAVAGSSAGTNFGGASIAIRPKFDVNDGSHEADSAGHIIAHEVAHYYWNNNVDWIDEGAAELLASLSEHARAGRPLTATNYPCPHAPNLAALETLNAVPESEAFTCNYSFGERIFLDLYRNMGDAEFQQAFRHIYHRSALANESDNPRSVGATVDDLRAAFGQVSGGASDPIVARWYDGSQPYDAAALDFSAADPALPQINGQIDRAYVSLAQQDPPVDQFSSNDVRGPILLNLEYSYQNAASDQEIRFEVVEAYQDGFVYRRRPGSISARPGYSGGTQWLQIGPAPGEPWAVGWHQVQVFDADRKVVDVQYVVTP